MYNFVTFKNVVGMVLTTYEQEFQQYFLGNRSGTIIDYFQFSAQ